MIVLNGFKTIWNGKVFHFRLCLLWVCRKKTPPETRAQTRSIGQDGENVLCVRADLSTESAVK